MSPMVKRPDALLPDESFASLRESLALEMGEHSLRPPLELIRERALTALGIAPEGYVDADPVRSALGTVLRRLLAADLPSPHSDDVRAYLSFLPVLIQEREVMLSV